MSDYSIHTEDNLWETTEPMQEFRLKKKKNGELVLQRALLVRHYNHNIFLGSNTDWRDVETVEEE